MESIYQNRGLLVLNSKFRIFLYWCCLISGLLSFISGFARSVVDFPLMVTGAINMLIALVGFLFLLNGQHEEPYLNDPQPPHRPRNDLSDPSNAAVERSESLTPDRKSFEF